jgi:hypothetical protein
MRKERIKVLHRPTTLETFYCLCDTPTWTETLIGLNKPYESFLIKLKDRKYFEDNKEKTTIKWMSAQMGFEITKVTKWIRLIYDDIFELNYDNPEKFMTEGIPCELHFKNYDDFASMRVWLNAIPRKYESLQFYFLKAKIGTDRFWVHNVTHDISDGKQVISISLRGGFCNEYREQLVQRAYFDGTLTLWGDRDKFDFEIDRILSERYR